MRNTITIPVVVITSDSGSIGLFTSDYCYGEGESIGAVITTGSNFELGDRNCRRWIRIYLVK